MANIHVDQVLSRLNVAEKVELLGGIDFWHTKSLPNHGVPSLRFSDGPNGVRGTKFFNGHRAACFPCGTALGSTFNQELLHEAGVKMGEEAKLKGAHVILGPTINMQRSPLGGRGFESIGEDPFLAGLGAAALIRGIQSTGVQATAKHFVCNDQEHKRNATQAIITERALREIYALPFQLCVKHASPGAIMTAYNGVNGTFCSENPKLIRHLLRNEWGWDGLVMSDWFGTYSTTAAVMAGLDVEMPGPVIFRGTALKTTVSMDKVREHVLDERVRKVLEFVNKCADAGVPEGAPENTGDTPETAALLRRIGNESIVLLKNEGNLLPLKRDKKASPPPPGSTSSGQQHSSASMSTNKSMGHHQTVVIGPNAKVATYHGGGSAALSAYYAVTPFDGISSKLASAPEYTVGAYSHKSLPLLGYALTTLSGQPGMTMRAYREKPSVSTREPQDEIGVLKTELIFVDYYHKNLDAEWYADFEASLAADEDCDWDMSLIVCGTAKLLVDDELVVDNSKDQEMGESFFGTGTVEVRGRVHLKKGQTYKITVQYGSTPTSKLSEARTLLPGGALRIGGCKVIDDKEEIARAAVLAKSADQVVICAGLNSDWETEGYDRANMDLPGHLNDMIAAVAEANPNLAVVMQSGTPVEMPWISKVPALVQAWYGGNETGNCIADVLFGDANPSGKLSLTFPVRVQDNPAFLNFRTEGGRTIYGEDVYVGYRYYEFAKLPVLFPFGHGLSYTRFEFSGIAVAEKDSNLSVSLHVKNVGRIKGAEVVQLYVSPKFQTKINRPRKELKGFAKVELAPAESRPVSIDVDTKYAISYWDEERDQWCAEKGEYDVIASDSSCLTSKTLTASFSVPTTFWWRGL